MPRTKSAVERRPILIIEDSADIRAAIGLLLEEEGFSTLEAANGEEGLRMMRSGILPSLVLVDLMMPILDGWEFRVRQAADPELAAIPTIAISAYGETWPGKANRTFERYLPKPFGADELLAAVHEMLSSRE